MLHPRVAEMIDARLVFEKLPGWHVPRAVLLRWVLSSILVWGPQRREDSL